MGLNVFEIFAKIGLDDSELKSGVLSAGKMISGLGKTFFKIGSVATTAAATVSTALAKSAVSSYAEYEQLVGGVDTLFKESSKKVQEYADNAYKTAGISANEYMETVTSFSASLLQSLGGDTDKAADVANMALIDMADNANKMGTAMESIQNAYQGFAKQNYTMLDNLKLGYGGTKEEMERLLSDAEKLSGVKYNISNLNDVYEAIHVIQEELGITGTTAKEAGDTISGSVGMVKAAWDNLVTGLVSDSADIDTLIDDFVVSSETLITNIYPAFEKALTGVGTLVEKMGNVIVKGLPSLASKILPSIIKTATNLVNSFVSVLPALVSVVVEQIVPLSIESLISSAPQIAESAVVLISQLAAGLGQQLPTLIPAVVQAVVTIAQTLIAPDNISMLIDAAIQLIEGLAYGMIEALPILIDSVPQIIEGLIVAFLQNLPKLIEVVLKVPAQLGVSLIAAILEMIPKLIGAIVMGLVEGVPEMVKSGGDLIDGLISAFTDNPMLDSFEEWWSELKDWWGGVIDDIFDWGVDLMQTFEDGIESMLGSDWVEFWEDIGGDIYDYLHFSQPDKGPLSGPNGFKTFGPDMIKTFVEGVKSNEPLLQNELNGVMEGVQTAFNTPITPDISGAIPLGYGSLQTSANSEQPIVIQVDGETFAKFVYKYNNREAQRVGATLTEAVSV